MNKETIIGLASDHAGYAMKEMVKALLTQKGIAFKDFGTHNEASCDYPDYAHSLAFAVENGEVFPGIAMCGSGEGMAITLNKHQGVRASLVWTKDIAHITRLHNDANILVMPARYINESQATDIVNEFLSTEFEGGRHINRIKKIPL